MVSAASVRPEVSGETPSSASRNVGTYDVRPMRMTPTPTDTSDAASSSRRENTHRGSTGSSARCSTRHEHDQQQGADDERADARHRQPLPRVPALQQREDQQAHARGQQQAAGPVDAVARALDGLVQVPDQQPRRRQAQRDVDEEDPVPATGTRRTPRRASGPTTDEMPHTLAMYPCALARSGDRVDVARDGDRHRLHGPGAQPLHRAERDQRRHAPREPAEDRAEQEQADAEQDHGLAADGVRELGVDGDAHRLRQQVHREQPREAGEAAEVRDDRRHRGGQDRRVDGDQAGGHHDRDQDRSALGPEADTARVGAWWSSGWASSGSALSMRHPRSLGSST